MKSKKAGVSMGGTIEYTRTKKKQQFINKIDRVKKKDAKVCVECEDNREGYCNRFKGWCSRVNYHCNGKTISYQEKLQQDKIKYELKKKKKKEKRRCNKTCNK